MSAPIPFTATLFHRRHIPRGRCVHGTWGAFCANVLAVAPEIACKEDLPGWSPATYRGDYRSLGSVERVYALGLDLDNEDTTVARAAGMWREYAGAICTTHSHEPDAPRLRVILLPSRPMTADEYTIVWRWARDRCARHCTVLDEGACDAARFWYLPAVRLGAKYEMRELRGHALDVDTILASAGQGRSAAANGSTGGGGSKGSIDLLLDGASGAARAHPLPGVHHHAPAQPQRSTSPRARKEVGAGARAPIPLTAPYFFGEAMRAAGLVWGTRSGGRLLVTCPWADAHSGGRSGDGSTVVMPPATRAGWGAFTCHHAHCKDRQSVDLLDVLPHSALATARRVCGGGPMRARVIRAFVRRLDARPGGFGIAGLDALDQLVLHLGLGCPPASLKYAAKLDSHTIKVGCEAHTALGSPATDAEARVLVGRDVQLTMGPRDEVKKISLVPAQPAATMSPEAP